MTVFFRSIRDGQTIYSAYTGMDLDTIQVLMSELLHTSITQISEQDYNDSLSQI